MAAPNFRDISYVRNHSIHSTLGKLKDWRAVEPLIKALKDEEKDVRKSAAEALGEIGDERAIKPLYEVSKDEDLKWNAERAIEKIYDKKSVESLVKELGDYNKDIRIFAVRALGKRGSQGVDPLIKALKDS